MPFERLTRLSRSASRKAFPTSWYLTWGLFAAYIAAVIALIVFDTAVSRWQKSIGLPWYATFVLVAVAFIAGLWALRRYARRAMKSRADFDSEVRFKKDDTGLHFATPQIEYLIKWTGISQMLLEHDGVVVSHGNLFFLIPDSVFPHAGERDEFVRDIYARMDDAARARSQQHLQPVLDALAGTART